jgi:hypothetical protein
MFLGVLAGRKRTRWLTSKKTNERLVGPALVGRPRPPPAASAAAAATRICRFHGHCSCSSRLCNACCNLRLPPPHGASSGYLHRAASPPAPTVARYCKKKTPSPTWLRPLSSASSNSARLSLSPAPARAARAAWGVDLAGLEVGAPRREPAAELEDVEAVGCKEAAAGTTRRQRLGRGR